MADERVGGAFVELTLDDGKFLKGLKKSEESVSSFQKKMGKLSENSIKAGKALSVGLTLPIVAAGAASLKFASDLEESANAVSVVFGEATPKLVKFGETAAEAVGLSQSSFNSLSTVIGAQLKQTGKDIDLVADDTIELTKRGADLASVFNVDVGTAMTALGSALRGEAEPARKFGINISEAALQAEALASGLVTSKSEITEQIKVQVRYNLIMEQSAQVQGDFANTSDSLANSTRIAKAELQNATAALGQELLPIAVKVVGKIREMVGVFADLDDNGRNTVIVLGAIAAGIGPLLLGLGQTITAVKALRGAMIALTASNPALLVIVGSIAAIGAAVALVNKRQERLKAESREVWATLAESVRDTKKEIEEFSEAAGNVEAFLGTVQMDDLDRYNELLDDVAEKYGVSRDEIILIAEQSENVAASTRNTLRYLKEQQTEQLAILALSATDELRRERILIRAMDAADLAKKRLKTSQEEAAAKAEIEGFQKRIFENEQKAVRLKEAAASGFITEEQQFERQLTLRQKELDLLTEKFLSGQNLSTAEQARYATLDGLIKTYLKSLDDTKDKTDKATGASKKLGDTAASEFLKMLDLLDNVKDKTDKATGATKTWEENLEEKVALAAYVWGASFAEMGEVASMFYDNAKERSDQYYADEFAKLEKDYQDKLKANGLLEKSEVDRLKAERAAAIADGNIELAKELENKIAKAKIEADYQKKKSDLAKEQAKEEKELALEQFKISKAIALGQAAIDTALAISRAISSALPPPANLVFAGVVGAIGAAQIAAIASQPTPKFAEGGVVQGSANSDKIPAMVKSGEMILNKPQQARLFNLANGSSGGGSVTSNLDVEAVVDEGVLFRVIQRGIIDQQIRIPREVIS